MEHTTPRADECRRCGEPVPTADCPCAVCPICGLNDDRHHPDCPESANQGENRCD